MNIVERFKVIIANEQEAELEPFLKGLTPEEKKQLTPLIKTLSQDYWTFGMVYNQEEKKQGTQVQQLMVQQCAFVCLNRADYEKTIVHGWFVLQPAFKKIIEWYAPAWLSDYVNDTRDNEFIRCRRKRGAATIKGNSGKRYSCHDL